MRRSDLREFASFIRREPYLVLFLAAISGFILYVSWRAP